MMRAIEIRTDGSVLVGGDLIGHVTFRDRLAEWLASGKFFATWSQDNDLDVEIDYLELRAEDAEEAIEKALYVLKSKDKPAAEANAEAIAVLGEVV